MKKINLEFLRKYILKKQKYSKYTSQELDNLNLDELKAIITGMHIMNRF